MVLAVTLGSTTPRAEIDGQVFTSATHRIRVTIPRGWRASDQRSYPGILLWMLRSQPEGRVIVGSEPLSQALYCAWPQACRALSQPLSARYACAVRAELERPNILLGPVQAGPKENVDAKLPSVWFEFTDGKSYVRQALAVNERIAVSFVLSTRSATDRATHARAFDQALRSLRELPEEPAPAAPAAPAATTDGSAPATPSEPAATSGPTPTAAAPAAAGIVATMFDPSRPCP